MLKCSSVEEIESAWQKFEAENSELFNAINDWKDEYSEKKEETEAIYEISTEIENPIEIAIIIHILDDSDVSECEIFNDYEELIEKIREIGGDFAEALADLIEDEYICSISAEDIINKIEENKSDSDEDDEEAETEDDEDDDSNEDAEEEDSES